MKVEASELQHLVKIDSVTPGTVFDYKTISGQVYQFLRIPVIKHAGLLVVGVRLDDGMYLCLSDGDYLSISVPVREDAKLVC